MDEVDRKILIYIQNEFPIDDRPYLKIAKDLGLDEFEVMNRIINLYNLGYIKKIIPKLSKSYIEKYERALVSIKANEKDIVKVSEFINSFENITHNYLRDHHYNIWFTISGKNFEEILKQIKIITEKLEIDDYIILRSVKSLKLDTEFEVKK
ncbi:MAG: Lrp/AsnC family transcriptional regulator [Thermoplasmata archaeon]|nr:Lrp/AsnC family transcriptional regulator [Thermoplasmata archaeon]